MHRAICRGDMPCCLLAAFMLVVVISSHAFGSDDETQPNKSGKAVKDSAKKEEAKKREEQIRKQQQAAIESQYKIMGKMMLTSELGFIRATCDVPPEHRPRVKEAGEKSLDVSIKQLAEMQSRPNRGAFNNFPDPEDSLRDALQSALKEVLPSEEYAKYESESNKRKDVIKNTTIDLIVSRIDRQLWLSPKQRTDITEAIATQWKDSNESWMSIANYGNRMIPEIPDSLIVPHLTTRQKSAWNKAQKVNLSSVRFLNRNWIGNTDDPNDDYWGAKEKEAPAKENDSKPVGLRSMSDERRLG